MATPRRFTVRGKGEGSVYKRDDGLWCASVELPSATGKRRRKVISSKDKATVIRKLSAIQTQLRTHGDLPTADQTVEQWFTYWLEDLLPKEGRPNTVKGYRTVIQKYIIPTIGKVRLEQLTPAHIRRVHTAILQAPKYPKDPSRGTLSSTYALNAHRIMASSLTTAEREGRVTRNVAKLTAAPRKAAREVLALDLEEVIHVLEVVSRQTHAELGSRWATSLLTGARRGEVIGLERDRVGDVIDLSWQLQRLKLTGVDGKPDVPADFEYRHLVGGLYLTRPKSAAGWRIVPLVEPLRGILQRYIAATPDNEFGLVWAPRGRPLDPDQDSAAWHDVLRDAEILKDVPLHGARHTTVDLLYLAGVPEDIIMEIVGHSTRSVTRGYKSQRNKTRLTDAMLQMSELLTPAVGEAPGTPAAISS
jgi:integrase